MALKGKTAKAKPKKSTTTRKPRKPSKSGDAEVRRVHAEVIEADPKRATSQQAEIDENDDDFVSDDEAYTGAEPAELDDSDISIEPATDATANDRLPVPIKGDSGSAVSTTDPVATYLAEIRRYRLLTKEQEYDLAVRYRETGDPQAAEALVTSNLRFVVKIAAEYSKFGAKLIDLIQEGNVGLMHGVREFNPYKGVRLITYAVWWIRGYIQEYLMRQYSMVRIGTTQNQRKLFYRLQKEKEKLDRMGQEPTVPLLSSRLGVTEAEVEMMSQRMSGRDVSLNQPVGADSTVSLLDLEPTEEKPIDDRIGEAEEVDVLRENIEKIRPGLSEKEAYILDQRLLSDEPLTLQEIGEQWGVTREAVRQMEARLMGKIRSAVTSSLEPELQEED